MSLSYLITFRHSPLPTQIIQVFVSSRSSKLFTIFPKSVFSHIAPYHAPFAPIIKMNYSLFPKGTLRLHLHCSLYLTCSPQLSLIFQDTAISNDFFKKPLWLCHITTGRDASGSQITFLRNERVLQSCDPSERFEYSKSFILACGIFCHIHKIHRQFFYSLLDYEL